MILLSLLIITGILTIGVIMITLVIGGTGFIVVFGDILICAAFIIFVIKYLIGRKKK